MELLKTIDALETLKATHVANELAAKLKGKSIGTYLPSLLKPVMKTPIRKTDYAGARDVHPMSSPFNDYDTFC